MLHKIKRHYEVIYFRQGKVLNNSLPHDVYSYSESGFVHSTDGICMDTKVLYGMPAGETNK